MVGIVGNKFLPDGIATEVKTLPIASVTGGTVNVNVTGVSGTGQIGTVTIEIAPGLTGVSGTSAIGSVTPQVAPSVTGVSGSGAIGSVTTSGSDNTNVTGVSGTGAVGSVGLALSGTTVGVNGTGAVGGAVYELKANPTGVSGSGQTGTLTPQVQVGPTGVAGTGQVATVSISTGGNVTVNLAGVSATGQVGTVTPEIQVSQTGVSGTGQIGTVTVTTSSGGDATVNVFGVSGTGQVGIISVTPVSPVSQAYGGGRGYKDPSGKAVHTENRYADPPKVAYPERIGSIYHPLVSDPHAYQDHLTGKKPKPEVVAEQIPEAITQPDNSASLAALEELKSLEVLRQLNEELARTQESDRQDAIRAEMARIEADRIKTEQAAIRLARQLDDEDAYFMLLAA